MLISPRPFARVAPPPGLDPPPDPGARAEPTDPSTLPGLGRDPSPIQHRELMS